jgi:hypothetical protein
LNNNKVESEDKTADPVIVQDIARQIAGFDSELQSGEAVESIEAGKIDADISGEGVAAYIPPIHIICTLTFGIFCPAWDMDPEKVQKMAESLAVLAQKYYPNAIDSGAEMLAVMSTIDAIGPNIVKPRRLPKQNPDREPEKQLPERTRRISEKKPVEYSEEKKQPIVPIDPSGDTQVVDLVLPE